MTQPALLLMLASILAGVGGEFFVRGLVSIAVWWRVAPGIVGATVAAFATSSPEMSVAVNSAAAGRPEIALGNVLGGNVVNIGLVLGIALLFAAAAAAPLVLGLLAIDGTWRAGAAHPLVCSYAVVPVLLAT